MRWLNRQNIGAASIVDRPAPAEVEPSDDPLRIAFVYCRNPLPMRRADQITVTHLLEFLSARGHSVDVFCFDGDAQSNANNALMADDIAWLESHCTRLVHVRHSRLRAVVGAMRAFSRGKPMQVGWLTSPALAKALSDSLEASNYDVLYAYYFRSAETVIRAKKRSAVDRDNVPSILAMQLSQSINTRRIRDNATNAVTKLIFSVESRLVSRYETRVWREFDRTALIGPVDVRAIETECRAHKQPIIDNWFYSPHGTDIRKFQPRKEIDPEPQSVLFAGTLFYPPNIQAAVWLVREIWPKVRLRLPDARLQIVGRDPAAEVLALASEAQGIEVVGSVPDLSEYMLRAAVCVNPVRAAGGMQNKLIEYFASGRPVVATHVANEGIDAPNDILELAESSDEFAAAVVKLLSDPKRAEEMGGRARNFAWQQWSWEAHFLRLEQNMRMLVSDAKGRGATSVEQ